MPFLSSAGRSLLIVLLGSSRGPKENQHQEQQQQKLQKKNMNEQKRTEMAKNKPSKKNTNKLSAVSARHFMRGKRRY
jgi:hypothetical protein